MVVEDSFLVRHVGVFRVINHYYQLLTQLGFVVDFASPHLGAIRMYDEQSTRTIVKRLKGRDSGTDIPTPWNGFEGEPRPIAGDALPSPLTFLEETLNIRRDFAVSVLTVPWISDLIPETETFSHAIVYDLVPNLSVLQALDLQVPDMHLEFAGQHHRGYLRYRDSVDYITCISERTAADFRMFYGARSKTLVDVPFRMNGEKSVSGQIVEADSHTILAVNVLDPRKGIATIAEALKTWDRAANWNLIVVGRERMAFERAAQLLDSMAFSCRTVTWYRSASDQLLDYLYESSSVLLFPSIYEGLGLPILEAQARGLPVISSGWSSCAEINLNPALMFEALGAGNVAQALETFCTEADILRGASLISATAGMLEGRSGPDGAFAASVR